MRHRLLAAITVSAAAASLACVSLAAAQTPNLTTVNDPQGRYAVDVPKSWASEVNFETAPSGRTVILAGADPECQFHAVPDIGSAGVSPDAFKRSWAAPFDAAKWEQTLTPFRAAFFKDGAPAISDVTTDTATSFFPTQKAIATSGAKKVWVSLHPRPGMIVYSFCRTWDDADPSATFASIQASFRTPQDASLSAAGAEAEAARAARLAEAEAAAAAAAAAAATSTTTEAGAQPAPTEAPKRRNMTRILR